MKIVEDRDIVISNLVDNIYKNFCNNLLIKTDDEQIFLKDLFLNINVNSPINLKSKFVRLDNILINDYLRDLSQCLVNKIPFLLLDINDCTLLNDIAKKKINKSILGYISTSGSTGQPKIIAIEDKTLTCNLLDLINNLPKFTSIGLFVSLSFSFGLNFLLSSFIVAKNLSIANQTKLNDIGYFIKFINNSNFDMIVCPSPLLNKISKNKIFKNIHRQNFSFVFGGDLCNFSSEFITFCKNNMIELYDIYGTTETGIISISKKINCLQGERFSLLNTIKPYHVLIKHNHLFLTIDKGYQGFYDISNKKKIFSNVDKKEENCIFSTNDLAKVEKQNTFMLLGRSDDIVKINGHRISLQEIEKYILQIHGVFDCIACTVKVDDSAYLISNIVIDKSLSCNDVYKYLEKKLPKYMIPILFTVSQILTNSHGKKDKRKVIENFKNNKLCLNNVLDLIELMMYSNNFIKLNEEILNESISQLGLDSLDIVSLTSALESKYLINFDFILVDRDTSILKIVKYIKGERHE